MGAVHSDIYFPSRYPTPEGAIAMRAVQYLQRCLLVTLFELGAWYLWRESSNSREQLRALIAFNSAHRCEAWKLILRNYLVLRPKIPFSPPGACVK